MINNAKILQFRYINTNDAYDLKYKWCSRIYEYPTILNFIDDVYSNDMIIHNTSAGHGQDLGFFMKEFIGDLNKIYKTVIHSDRLSTPEWNIIKFDLLADKHEVQYDIVLNISVIEHLPEEYRILALNNLWSILKPNGYLILTFDLPAINISQVENWCDGLCNIKHENAVNGLNSKYPQPQYSGYNFILLIIQRENE